MAILIWKEDFLAGGDVRTSAESQEFLVARATPRTKPTQSGSQRRDARVLTLSSFLDRSFCRLKTLWVVAFIFQVSVNF